MESKKGEGPLHRPVLYQEVLDFLAPESPKRYLDCTAGAGGHAEGILNACGPAGQLLAIDLDPSAVALTAERLAPFGERAIVRHASYLESADILNEIGWKEVDGIVMDLGVSSMQLDQTDRGFSFRKNGPLDMRFDPRRGKSAAELVNSLDESDLAELIWKYSEERYSRKIAHAILAARPLHSTAELAEVVRRAVGRTHEKQDPATRTFQALRIAANDELSTIEQALPQLIGRLAPKGRIAVISFHSLEDRIVKQTFKRESADCICPPEQLVCTCGHRRQIQLVTHRPLAPSEAEIAQNPRARSARLRVAEKL